MVILCIILYGGFSMSDRVLNYSIKEEYDHELLEIQNKLTQIENGRVLELSHANGDGSLSHNVGQLRKMISSLLNKIQNGKDGTDTEIAKLFVNPDK